MEITQTAIAGTMESSDVMITLEPGDGKIEIYLTSTVEKQFGNQIRHVIAETLTQLGVSSAKMKVVDKGALNCAIRARVKAAVYRGAGQTQYSWGGGNR